MSVILADKEGTHRKLFEAHRAMATAGTQIHEVIIALHAAGRYEESRKQLEPSIASLEKARALVDEALRVAGNGRSELIRQTGCDGTCSTRGEKD